MKIYRMPLSKIVLLSMLALGVAGCKAMETDPVTITTPLGAVVCQLYTDSSTIFDKAISYPVGMSEVEATAYCKEFGALN